MRYLHYLIYMIMSKLNHKFLIAEHSASSKAQNWTFGSSMFPISLTSFFMRNMQYAESSNQTIEGANIIMQIDKLPFCSVLKRTGKNSVHPLKHFFFLQHHQVLACFFLSRQDPSRFGLQVHNSICKVTFFGYPFWFPFHTLSIMNVLHNHWIE